MTNLSEISAWCCLVVLIGCNDSMKAVERPPPAAAVDIANVERATVPSPNGEAAQQAASSATAPVAEGDGEASPAAQCGRICAKSTELSCPRAAECETMCKESMVLPACAREMVAANECMLAQPIAKWACTPDGLAAIKDGCEAAQEKFMSCLAKL